ncbi:MAG TPA: hypothetical protein VIY47_05460 [Ignavibacteriaceae bacterium]
MPMFYCLKHIISVFLLAVFLFKGLGSLFPFSAIALTELFAESEKESAVKEVNEKEFFNDSQYAGVWLDALPAIAVKYKNQKLTNYRQNPFIPVATPPPNVA